MPGRDPLSGGESPDDEARGGLESLLDAQTHSAESFAAGRGLIQGDLEPPPGEATDFGLDRAVAKLAQQLAHEKVQGPSAVDIVGAAQPRSAAGTGRVVSEPPGPPPESGAKPGPEAKTPELTVPGFGDAARPHAVDTGPIAGDPFAGGVPKRPMPAGQSQIGSERGPVPSDFYGRDTPPPPAPEPVATGRYGTCPVPGPSYGETLAPSGQPGPGSQPPLPSAGSPHAGSPHAAAASPPAGAPHPGSPRGGSPHVGSPHGGAPHGGSPHAGSPHGGSPHAGSPPAWAPYDHPDGEETGVAPGFGDSDPTPIGTANPPLIPLPADPPPRLPPDPVTAKAPLEHTERAPVQPRPPRPAAKTPTPWTWVGFVLVGAVVGSAAVVLATLALSGS